MAEGLCSTTSPGNGTDRQRAYELAELRFNTGNDSLFPALEAARRLNGLNAEIATKEVDVLKAQITIYRALGGGWMPPGVAAGNVVQ